MYSTLGSPSFSKYHYPLGDANLLIFMIIHIHSDCFPLLQCQPPSLATADGLILIQTITEHVTKISLKTCRSGIPHTSDRWLIDTSHSHFPSAWYEHQPAHTALLLRLPRTRLLSAVTFKPSSREAEAGVGEQPGLHVSFRTARATW